MTTESGGLSKEEFLLVQEQLLQLRNENYGLKEELKKKSQQNTPKNEALQFASKLINRASSKKDEKDGEIEGLRRKLETQEEEFRLQQATLFEELKTLSAQNEALKSQMSSYSDHPLEKEAGTPSVDVAELENQIKQLKEEKTLLCQETVPALNRKIANLKEQIENCDTLNVELEDRVLALTAEAEATFSEKELLDEENCRLMEEMTVQRKEHAEILEEMQARTQEVVEENRVYAAEERKLSKEKKENLATIREQMIQIEGLDAEIMISHNEFAEATKEIAKLKENHQKEVSELTEQLEKLKSEIEHRYEIQKSTAESEKLQEKALEDRILLLETRYQLEVDDQKKSFETEKEQLLLKITSLEEKLKASEEEKKAAIKKQVALVKELQKTLKEERKRADSYERKSEERGGWHVVSQDQDKQSSHTFDGNDSVSSLSAIESENVELITRLASLQKIHSENADTILQLEADNSRLRREVTEKGDLIESLIREKPLGLGNPGSPSYNSQQPKIEVSFRKLLNTLGQDSSASDVKEMNKKLQRMLEETLSKNIILQRDLQTLMERTGL